MPPRGVREERKCDATIRHHRPQAAAAEGAVRSARTLEGREPETAPAVSETPTGTKFLLTLHDVAAGRALSVAERTPHDYGITAGMSVMLGLIENMASETDAEPSE